MSGRELHLDIEGLSPEEYGRALARLASPLEPWQIEAAARIIAGFPPASISHTPQDPA